jgi:membrane protein implicated in regulation of membrane protease activity
MTWTDFYLICFIVGFFFSVISFLAGGFHAHLHLPGWGHHFVHPVFDSSHHCTAHSNQISVFNVPTIMTFLAWFGGIGYLMSHVYHFWFLLTLVVALLAGCTGAAFVFWFFAKVLMAHDHSMDPADYRMTGVLATVNSTIREGGTGEIVYSQGGTRRSSGARSEDGSAIPKGEEVVVVKYEKGIAYVCRWETMMDENRPEKP